VRFHQRSHSPADYGTVTMQKTRHVSCDHLTRPETSEKSLKFPVSHR
jgi:hypothetical protein